MVADALSRLEPHEVHGKYEVEQGVDTFSGVESQDGPRGSTTHWPPYRPTPPPAHEKLLNQRAPGGLGPP